MLATWHELIDGGIAVRRRRRTWPARPSRCGPVCRTATAAALGVVDGDAVTRRRRRPARWRRRCVVDDTAADGVGVAARPITAPARVRKTLGAVHGDRVTVTRGAGTPDDAAVSACSLTPAALERDPGRFGHDADLAGADQGARRVRVPGRDDAVLDRLRAQGRRPDAEPDRPEPDRSVGHPAVAGRRREARLQGRDHPDAGRQAGVLDRAGRVRGAGVPGVLGHPVRPDGVDVRPPHARCS